MTKRVFLAYLIAYVPVPIAIWFGLTVQSLGGFIGFFLLLAMICSVSIVVVIDRFKFDKGFQNEEESGGFIAGLAGPEFWYLIVAAAHNFGTRPFSPKIPPDTSTLVFGYSMLVLILALFGGLSAYCMHLFLARELGLGPWRWKLPLFSF